MKIKEISIEGLFGIFNHVIPLNMNERITIIHSPNGYGKTTVLKLINALFSSDDSELYKVPYKSFSVVFDDESFLRVKKLQNGAKYNLGFFYSGNVRQSEFSLIRAKHSEYTKKLFQDIFKSLKENTLTEDVQKSDESASLELGEDLKSLTDQIPICLIESQRLIKLINIEDLSFENNNFFIVEGLAKELVRKIDASLAQYAAISQALDRTFPVRMISQKTPSVYTQDYLRDKLEELEKARERLIDIGLLDDIEESPPHIQTEIDKSLIEDITKGILAVYIEDTEKKLDVLSNIADKIVVFKRIINNWFKYKKLEIDKKEGFFFVTDKGDRLSPRDLSSGEQHELIMLYELLFKAEAGSLILIDEPEISLHVGWQSQFLQELLEITKLADLDILMATHSPDIIQDRWDLTVELKGK
jgi:predicted ATP-binding protein involved in virulence